VIASGENDPSEIATDGARVFWRNVDGILSCPVAGCGADRRIVSADPRGAPFRSVLLVDAANVYWTNTYGDAGVRFNVFTCPKGGCGPGDAARTTLSGPGLDDLAYLRIADGSFYWADSTSYGSIWTCPVVGGCGSTNGNLKRLLPTSDPNAVIYSGLTIVGGSFFWATSPAGTIRSCALTGCAAPSGGGLLATLASGQSNVDNIVSDGVRLYWGRTNGPLSTCPLSGCVGMPPAVVPGQRSVLGLTYDAATRMLVWSVTDSPTSESIYECAAAGCASPTLLASGPPKGELTAFGSYVYWTNTEGEVMRVAE
jgi:hypothetical protein